MTTMVRVRGVKRYRDRHGRWRCYHRKSGKALKAEFGTAEFFLELKSIEEGQKARDPSPGTLGLVIKAYREFPAFKDKATATRAGYLRYIDVAKSLHGMALMDIDGPFLAQVRDKISAKRGRRTANYALAMLSILFEFAKERGWAKDNPAKGVKRVKRERDRPRANRPWSLEERQVVLDAAPWQLKVPIALAMFTGLRKTDVIGLTRVVLKSGSIETSKNGEEVFLPVHPDLGLILDMAPKHTAVTIAATCRGHPLDGKRVQLVVLQADRQAGGGWPRRHRTHVPRPASHRRDAACGSRGEPRRHSPRARPEDACDGPALQRPGEQAGGHARDGSPPRSARPEERKASRWCLTIRAICLTSGERVG